MHSLCCCCPPGDFEDDIDVFIPPQPIRMKTRATEVKVKETDAGVLITGHGSAFADVALEQNAAYWEVLVSEVGKSGAPGVGVARDDLPAHLMNSSIGDTVSSWAMKAQTLAEGDVVGVFFSQDRMPNLTFQLNGLPVESDVNLVRGQVCPAVSVHSGAKLLVRFDPRLFTHAPADTPYTEIRKPRQML
mmetsp:Transcript_40365/g.107059  ORF Transcript_40365/g.107059 Transcript_40365/m.107059 type:complete len:189 (-) Transcript_40365:163-729(-)